MPKVMLSILYLDGHMEEFQVKRVSNISSKCSIQFLYFERPGDIRGGGTKLRMEQINCWEVEVFWN